MTSQRTGLQTCVLYDGLPESAASRGRKWGIFPSGESSAGERHKLLLQNNQFTVAKRNFAWSETLEKAAARSTSSVCFTLCSQLFKPSVVLCYPCTHTLRRFSNYITLCWRGQPQVNFAEIMSPRCHPEILASLAYFIFFRQNIITRKPPLGK